MSLSFSLSTCVCVGGGGGGVNHKTSTGISIATATQWRLILLIMNALLTTPVNSNYRILLPPLFFKSLPALLVSKPHNVHFLPRHKSFTLAFVGSLSLSRTSRPTIRSSPIKFFSTSLSSPDISKSVRILWFNSLDIHLFSTHKLDRKTMIGTNTQREGLLWSQSEGSKHIPTHARRGAFSKKKKAQNLQEQPIQRGEGPRPSLQPRKVVGANNNHPFRAIQQGWKGAWPHTIASTL